MPHLVRVPRGRDVAATGLAGLFRASAAPVYYPMRCQEAAAEAVAERDDEADSAAEHESSGEEPGRFPSVGHERMWDLMAEGR
ncbi:MAG: hypothetical protein JWR58_5473 [Pseudonocardia sp.]|jgi:hypothetical protein|nr:hypothetical protein [Pseudonocardia sp.]